jgi:hypothetical protein
MSAQVEIVAPASGRFETWVLAAVVTAILVIAGVGVDLRQIEDRGQPRLFDWQISAFYDLNATDQAVYNALSAASEELWWIHGDILTFGSEEERADPWPTVAELDAEYLMPPFTRDMAWSQQGSVEWERVASFSFEGSTVYFGSGGQAAEQTAYLLMLSHVHKGASYTNGATIWVHADPDVSAPDTVVRDSLILNGWKEVVPYSGAMEVERLKGN